MKKKKIEVGFAKKDEIDFGMLNEQYRDGTIKVDEKFWDEYVSARFSFDVLHATLVKKVPQSKRKQYFKNQLNVLRKEIKRE